MISEDEAFRSRIDLADLPLSLRIGFERSGVSFIGIVGCGSWISAKWMKTSIIGDWK